MTARSGDIKRQPLRAIKGEATAVRNKDPSGAFAHWRLLFLDYQGGLHVAVKECEFYDTIGGPNLAEDCIATASSERAGAPPSEAFNGETVTLSDEWASDTNQTTGQWLAAQLSTDAEIIGCRIYTSSYYDYNTRPTNIAVQYSPDGGINWYTKWTFGASWTAADNVVEYRTSYYTAGETVTVTLPLLTVDAEYVAGETNNEEGLTLPFLQVEGHSTESGGKLSRLAAGGTMLNGKISVARPPVSLPALELDAQAAVGTALKAGVKLPALTAKAATPNSGHIALPALELNGSGATGWRSTANVRLPRLRVSASSEGVGGSNDRVLTGAPSLPLVEIDGEAPTGKTLSVAAKLQRLTMVAAGDSGAVTSGVINLPIVELTGAGFPEVVGTAALVVPFLQLQARASNSIDEPNIGQAGVSTTVLAMNAATKGLTEFTNYTANSFALFNGQHLLANGTGVFAMEGDTDNGAAINALVQLPTTDYRELEGGDSDVRADALKRVIEAFVGYRTDGDLVLTVIADEGVTYEYRLHATGLTGIHTARAKFRKGVTGRYWQLQLRNENGADFELESIEAIVKGLGRRLR